MVKSLKYFWKAARFLLLLALLAIIGTGIWLHGGQRSLAFAKPWVEATLNTPDAPYTITLSDITVDWRDVTELGKLRIANVSIAKRDGNIFATLPELYATIDPIGFLPNRHLLHKVIVRKPHLFMTRNVEGVLALGIEGSAAPMELADMVAFFVGPETADADNPGNDWVPPSLPFHDFIIENASFAFSDEASQTRITSNPFDFSLRRKGRSYDALLAMPFMVDAQKVMVSGGLRALPSTREHVLGLQFSQFPARLACLFDTCPPAVAAEGVLDGSIAVAIDDRTLTARGFRMLLNTKKTTLTAPEWFAEPLKLGDSSLAVEGDWSKKNIALTSAKLQLEDTRITASGQANKAENGWYVKGSGESTRLDIAKLYKYWPLFMAPDSRSWVTSKLKSGYAAKGTIKLNFTPEDFAAEYFPESSIEATADAREITFEYLPGFPLVEKMNGMAYFTATTVRVEGAGGRLLNGTKIRQAVLWCPELNSLNNPMEATISLSAPAADVVQMLALKHFPFDDDFGLDAKTIQGSAEAEMKLKFLAFSGKENSDPNEINLDAVDYDINATLKELAQKNAYGGYDVQGLNGALNASNTGWKFDGALRVGDSGEQDVTIAQKTNKPLHLSVKGRATSDTPPVNDFTLTYDSSSPVPKLELRGKRVDASTTYGGKENSLLADFPAMALEVDLGALALVANMPLTDVKGSMHCTKTRCESAHFTAKAGAADIAANISTAGGGRQFLLTASNAGSFLKALDISDRISKGALEMRGDYDDLQTPPQLNAHLRISDFITQNSQILGRILSVGSLTGLANVLTGEGIAFEKLTARILSQGGLITVEKGKANGAAIGITIGGTVDTRSTRLNLKGVVVPAYALNSLIGKIPVIGALAGGEGEGLIAFNYWVKGTYAEPDVGVNPLSGLTPGFLRGIFSGGDEATKKKTNSKANGAPSVGNNPVSNVHKP